MKTFLKEAVLKVVDSRRKLNNKYKNPDPERAVMLKHNWKP